MKSRNNRLTIGQDDSSAYDDGMTWPGFHSHGARTALEPRDITGLGLMSLCLNADNRNFVNLALVKAGIWKDKPAEIIAVPARLAA